MTSQPSHSDTELPVVVHPLPTIGPRQYVIIGVILTIITAVELAVSYSDLGTLMVPILIILSAVKFAIVVAFFMHLRFDNPALTRFFVFGFMLASAIMFALLGLFWNDSTLPTVVPQEHVEAPAASAGGGGAATTVKVQLKEFTLTFPDVSHGSVKFEVQNSGTVVHNLRIVKSDAAPTSLAQAAGAVDESKLKLVAKSADINPGATGAATGTLEAGNYIAFCNVIGHYQLGMATKLTVK